VSIVTYVFGIVAALAVIVVVIQLLRHRRLRERHAIWWIVAGILALIIGVFPQVLAGAAALLGIAVPTNLIFFVSLAILVVVALQASAELTNLEAQSRDLAERIALLELRVGELESPTVRPGDDGTPPEH
jgi:hypothetical protein